MAGSLRENLDDQEDEEADFDDDDDPKFADAGLGEQHLELAVQLDHFVDVRVYSVVHLVQHLILQLHLLFEVLVFVVQFAHDVRDLVQLFVCFCKLLLIVVHDLLVAHLFGVVVLAFLVSLGFVLCVRLEVCKLFLHVDFGTGIAHGFLVLDELGCCH